MSQADMLPRVVRVIPASSSWLLEVDDDWDTMTEEQRQDYIWEAAIDNGKVSFDYEPNTGEKP